MHVVHAVYPCPPDPGIREDRPLPSAVGIAEREDASCAPPFRASVGGSCHPVKSD
jgi:hypothetical protein